MARRVVWSALTPRVVVGTYRTLDPLSMEKPLHAQPGGSEVRSRRWREPRIVPCRRKNRQEGSPPRGTAGQLTV
jgi:hypothetical protein